MEIPKRHFKLIQECAVYSNDAYKQSIKGTYIEDEATDAQSWVVFDSTYNDIIITGQGTTSLRDWSLDFQIWRTTVKYLGNTQVHAGFVKQYEAIRSRIHQRVKTLLAEHANSRIVCTGHSLFGAIATIAALDCALQYDVPIHCVTFGSPRVGGKHFAKLFNRSIDISYRCVQRKDPVTFTPLPLRFKHVRGGVKFDKTVDSVNLYNCFGCRIADHNMKDYEAFALSVPNP